MREIKIGNNDAGQRLDKFLSKSMPTLPLSLLYKYLRKKCVKLNGRHCTDGATKLCAGDTLALYVNEDFFSAEAKSVAPYTQGALDVVYEDGNIIVANKPSGVSAHPDEAQRTGTLIDVIISYEVYRGEYDPESEQSFAPALCNRIDRNTSGLVIAAKNAESLREMNDIIKNRDIVKRYRCLVRGVMDEKSGTLKNYLLKDENSKTVTVFDAPRPDAKTAVLDYEVVRTLHLSDGSMATELDILLHTGRTHQIRAQLAHIGHSLLGDGKYGTTYAKDKACGFPSQALCAYSVEFMLTEKYDLLSYLDGRKISIEPTFQR